MTVIDRDRRRACRMAHAFGVAATAAVALLLVTVGQFRTHPVPLAVLVAAGSVLAVAAGLAADLVARPARVVLGDGWLATSRLGRWRRVRTDQLAGLAPNPHAAGSVVLVDEAGDRAEIEVRFLVRNPLIWERISLDVTRARRSGKLDLAEPESRFWQSVARQVAEADRRTVACLEFGPRTTAPSRSR
jgi:hypothetical protein